MKSKYHRAENLGTIPNLQGSDFEALDFFCYRIHAGNVVAGWWTDLDTGEPKDRNFGELIALVHSEISEGLEGHRKNLMDNHLPQYPMWWVEMADAFIRIADMCGADEVPLGEVVQAKLAYNAQRKDHKIENRQADGGVKY